MNNPFDLVGKVILVTGASSGIGRACAIQCTHRGAAVILLARNLERLEETAALLPEESRYFLIQHDLSEDSLPEEQLMKAVTLLGKLNGLIYAAGISTTLPLRMTDDEKLISFYKTNVAGAIRLCKWLSKPANFSADGASIVLLASVMGMVGEAGKTIYSLTKGALIAGARSLAIELAPKKIRVNTLSPGVVVTPMTEGAFYSQHADAREKIVSLHPLGVGQANDVAYASVYLLSDAARWITGANIPVDGGYTAR